MRTALVAGNWKMNGSSDFITELMKGLNSHLSSANTAQVLVCPPFVYLSQVGELAKESSILLGAQNASAHER